MRIAKLPNFFVLFLLPACIGVDYIDDPVIGAKIEITSGLQIPLMPSQTTQIEAVYYDEYGIEKVVEMDWTTSKPSVATVDQNGLVTAVNGGQTVIQASYNGILSSTVNINVVLGPDDVAVVTLTLTQTNLEIGQSVDLSDHIKVTNINGDELFGKTAEWFSENESILSVDETGVVTAIGNGIAGIHAKVEGVKSNSVNFVVGMSRVADFESAGGYTAIGTATLRLQGEDLILEFSDNFQTSFALGTFVYLANSTNGPTVRSNGFEVAQITTNGSKTFNISDLDDNIGLFDYRYVIILCKPAQVTFGYADLNN